MGFAGDIVAAPFASAISASNPYGDHESREGLLVAHSVTAKWAKGTGDPAGDECQNLVAAPIPILEVGKGSTSRGAGPNGSGIGQPGDPMFTLQAGAQHAIAFSCKDHGADATDVGVTPTLRAMGGSLPNGGGQIAVAMTFDWQKGNDLNNVRPSTMNIAVEHAQTLGSTRVPALAHGWSVRRLTPTECERLQGFPDGHTLVPWRGGLMPDGPRYKMLGNSMACNVMRWIGRRIEVVDALEGVPALMAAE